MEFGVYSAADSASFVNFISSNVFPEATLKLVITKAEEKDIITAHKDVYCGDDKEPEFTIICRKLVYDKDLFLRYLKKVEEKRSLAQGFFKESTKEKICSIIDTVNTLSSLVLKDVPGIVKNMRTDELVVTEDVASFDFEDISGCEESLFKEENYPICGGEEEGPQFVPLTRVLELRHRQDPIFSENLFSDGALVQPFYNEFLVFNKGYGFIAETFREVFPEFHVTVHKKFPKLELAEQMLWYQTNKLVSNDKRQIAAVVIEKIRLFFDCSFDKKKKSDHSNAISEEVPFFDTDDLGGPIVSPVGNDLRGYEIVPLPPSHLSVANKNTNDNSSNLYKLHSLQTLHNFGNLADMTAAIVPGQHMQQMQQMHQSIPIQPNMQHMPMQSTPSMPMPMQRQMQMPQQQQQQQQQQPMHGTMQRSGTMQFSLPRDTRKQQMDPTSSFAQAFAVDASPVKDAFDPAGWRKDTRKEQGDANVHVEKRLIIKEFIDSQCHRVPGTKIKSSKLFEAFRTHYNTCNHVVEFDKAFNQTSFSTIMKQVSTYDTRREKDGIYWTDLHVGEVSLEMQEEMRRQHLISAASLPFGQTTHIVVPRTIQPLLLD
jgi:hypothetical protein